MSRLVADGYVFGSFVDDAAKTGRTIYLRHDVDYSLELAVELAELNNDLGVRGTFFVQVRAAFYNVFAPHEAERIRRLPSLGQRVALHYASDGGGANADDVAADFELLRRVAHSLDPAFSWHRPMPGFLDRPETEVPGLVNVYGRRFFRETPYLSDSTHRCTVDELEAALADNDKLELQLLLHPVNWIAGGSSGLEILVRGWIRVLRDHERTLLENRTYVGRFPNGMPPELLTEFEREVLAAASAG